MNMMNWVIKMNWDQLRLRRSPVRIHFMSGSTNTVFHHGLHCKGGTTLLVWRGLWGEPCFCSNGEHDDLWWSMTFWRWLILCKKKSTWTSYGHVKGLWLKVSMILVNFFSKCRCFGLLTCGLTCGFGLGSTSVLVRTGWCSLDAYQSSRFLSVYGGLGWWSVVMWNSVYRNDNDKNDNICMIIYDDIW